MSALRGIVALTLVTALAGPFASGASAASTNGAQPLTTTTNPLSGGVSPLAPTPTTTSATPPAVTTNATTSSGSGGLSPGDAIAIAAGAIVLLAAISFFIWRDARRRAPVRPPAASAGIGGDEARPGTKPKPKPRKLSPVERRRRKRGRARR